MRRASYWLIALGSSLMAMGAVAAAPPGPPAASAMSGQPPAASSTPADPELQKLLDRLSELSDYIGRNSQAEQAWRYQLAQAEVLQQVALRSRAEERDRWLRMAVDSYYSAAVQSPASDNTALAWMAQIPGLIARAYPNSPVAAYAALQDVKARYNRVLARGGDNLARDQAQYCMLLQRFAQDYPKSEEAPKAMMEAAAIWELLSRPEQARLCYRYLTEVYPHQAAARKAGGALSRLGLDGESVHLQLPLLYDAGDAPFDLDGLRGKLVIVYLWASTCHEASEDFQTLKFLSDHYRARGLEVVQVNLDSDPSRGRECLAGQLTAGCHLYQRGGLDSPLAERYGLQSLPHCFLVSREGKLLQQAQHPSEFVSSVNGRLTGGR